MGWAIPISSSIKVSAHGLRSLGADGQIDQHQPPRDSLERGQGLIRALRKQVTSSPLWLGIDNVVDRFVRDA